MEAHEFKPGDVVAIKSGGPKMTVVEIAEDQLGQMTVWVEWFDEKKQVIEKGTVALSSIELAT